jgi:hypothetical protein
LRAAPSHAAEQVDLELVIATDVSYSVDDMEARMQREGSVTAFRSPEVVEAIKAGSLGKIAVAYIDFSNANASRVVVDWQVVHDKASADAFADAIAVAPQDRRRADLDLERDRSRRAHDRGQRLRGMKQVIDVSGDGPTTRAGGSITSATRWWREASSSTGFRSSPKPTSSTSIISPISTNTTPAA